MAATVVVELWVLLVAGVSAVEEEGVGLPSRPSARIYLRLGPGLGSVLLVVVVVPLAVALVVVQLLRVEGALQLWEDRRPREGGGLLLLHLEMILMILMMMRMLLLPPPTGSEKETLGEYLYTSRLQVPFGDDHFINV